MYQSCQAVLDKISIQEVQEIIESEDTTPQKSLGPEAIAKWLVTECNLLREDLELCMRSREMTFDALRRVGVQIGPARRVAEFCRQEGVTGGLQQLSADVIARIFEQQQQRGGETETESD